MSLEHGVRAAPGDAAASDAPSSPSEWLDAARAVHWPAPDLDQEETSGAPLLTPRAVHSARARRLALSSCNDVSVLESTLHGGTLLEQRAALARLALLARDAPSGEPVEAEIVDSEPELERDVLSWLSARGGAGAREARSTLAEAAALVERVEARLRASVQGVGASDPLAELEPHERATLSLHLRGATDFVVGCVIDELLESLALPDARPSARLLVGLRPAADARLVPALASALLDSADLNLRAEAARVLSRIDDPRVEPLLGAAYQTASAREERVALIEAFGIQGRVVDSPFLREALDHYDSQFRAAERATAGDGTLPPSSGARARGPSALVAALDAIFDVALIEAALRFASHDHVEVQRAAVRAIGRAGDDTALAWFEAMDARIPDGLEAELEAARTAIVCRIELRGEKPAQLALAERRSRLRRALAQKFSRGLDVTPTKRHRALAWLLMLRALVVYLFGGTERASKLSYLAHQADPRWYAPSHFQGRLWQRAGDGARAVAGYRRALAVAPRHLFRRPRWISPIVSAFVARAERLLVGGHDVRAERLLGELWSYDLSRAAPPVRLALHRCRRQLALSRTVHGARAQGNAPERASP